MTTSRDRDLATRFDVIAGLALAVALVSFAVTVYEQDPRASQLVVELGENTHSFT